MRVGHGCMIWTASTSDARVQQRILEDKMQFWEETKNELVAEWQASVMFFISRHACKTPTCIAVPTADDSRCS